MRVEPGYVTVRQTTELKGKIAYRDTDSSSRSSGASANLGEKGLRVDLQVPPKIVVASEALDRTISTLAAACHRVGLVWNHVATNTGANSAAFMNSKSMLLFSGSDVVRLLGIVDADRVLANWVLWSGSDRQHSKLLRAGLAASRSLRTASNSLDRALHGASFIGNASTIQNDSLDAG